MRLLPDLVEYDGTEGCCLEQDPTGLLNEGFRYRDPSTGTFLTRDPLGFKAGLNNYTYVHQNPWTHFDPEGLDDNKPKPQPQQHTQTQATHTNQSSKHPTSSTHETPSTPDKSAKKTKDGGDTETVNKDGSITMHDKQLQVDTDGTPKKEMSPQGWHDPDWKPQTSWSTDAKGNIRFLGIGLEAARRLLRYSSNRNQYIGIKKDKRAEIMIQSHRKRARS
jgi:RHS repeat-associated protein